MGSPTQGAWECVHGVDGRDPCDQCYGEPEIDPDNGVVTMREQPQAPHPGRLGAPRWIMYWVATIDAHLGAGRATIRTRAIVAGHHPHRLGHPDHVPGPRGTRRTERPGPGHHVQYATRWFLTEAEYEAWKDTLPVVEQIDADMLAHIGHMPWEDQPRACVACQVRQKMMETLQ